MIDDIIFFFYVMLLVRFTLSFNFVVRFVFQHSTFVMLPDKSSDYLVGKGIDKNTSYTCTDICFKFPALAATKTTLIKMS